MKLFKVMKQIMEHIEVVFHILKVLFKAIDCLPYKQMAAKLIVYGMSPFMLMFQIIYVQHHKQYVEMGSDINDWMSVLEGVCPPSDS